MKSALVIAIALSLASSSVGRADEKPAENHRAAAGDLYREGQRQYELNDFAKALELFKHAYTLFDEPALLYNIAQCYRQLGDEGQAIKFYKSYLRKVPDATNREDVVRLLAALEKSYDEKRAKAERQHAEAEQLTKQRGQVDAAERTAKAAQLEADAIVKRRELERQQTRAKPIYKRWWLWTTVALVAAAGAGAGVGVYYGTRTTPFATSLPAFQLGLTFR